MNPTEEVGVLSTLNKVDISYLKALEEVSIIDLAFITVESKKSKTTKVKLAEKLKKVSLILEDPTKVIQVGKLLDPNING